MKRWKKYLSLGLAITMMTCTPQALWAAEFSAGNTDPAVFEAGDETENDPAVESGDEFGAGELKQELDDAFENRQETPTEDKEPCGDPVYSRQSAEGYVMQLFSEGKLEKTYIIPYVGVDTAKAPEALKRKGYIFKEWNTKEDSTGKVLNPEILLKSCLYQRIWKYQFRKQERKQTRNQKVMRVLISI